jgi:hypothetical protein
VLTAGPAAPHCTVAIRISALQQTPVFCSTAASRATASRRPPLYLVPDGSLGGGFRNMGTMVHRMLCTIIVHVVELVIPQPLPFASIRLQLQGRQAMQQILKNPTIGTWSNSKGAVHFLISNLAAARHPRHPPDAESQYVSVAGHIQFAPTPSCIGPGAQVRHKRSISARIHSRTWCTPLRLLV